MSELKQASATAQLRAQETKHGNVVGIDRADGASDDEPIRAMLDAVEAAEGRMVAAEGVAMVNRTYRLPERPTSLAAADAEQLRRFEAWIAAGEPSTPSLAASGRPGEIAAIPPEVIGRAAYRPVDHATTAQTTRAGLEPDIPGAIAAVRYPDPLVIVEHDGGRHEAQCQLCPAGPMQATCTADNAGTARAGMAGHLREAHGRSPWAGVQ